MTPFKRTKYNKTSGVYKIVCSQSGKFYVGSSVNLYKRSCFHRSELRKGEHHCRHLQNAYNKYGEDCFEFELLEFCDRVSVEERETFYLNKYDFELELMNSTRHYKGSFHKMSEETKRKISESKLGKPAPNKGKPMSVEQRGILAKVRRERHGKSVDVYTKTGDFVETVVGVHYVAEKYKADRRSLQRCLAGQSRFSSIHGFVFRYHGEPFKHI